MRAITRLLLVVAMLLNGAMIANAQAPGRGLQFPSRFIVAGDLLVAQPKGEFGSYVHQGYGGNLVFMFKLDEAGVLSLRADVGGMEYGSERKRVPFLPFTGRVSLDVTTSNNVFWGAIGPQITLLTKGPVRPYVNAAIGFQDFVTQTSLSGSDNSGDYASSTNSDDATFAYIFGGGLYIPLGKTSTSASLNLGARYHFGGTARYLRKGGITDNPDGTITLNRISSKTDVIMWQVGVSVPIPAHAGR